MFGTASPFPPENQCSPTTYFFLSFPQGTRPGSILLILLNARPFLFPSRSQRSILGHYPQECYSMVGLRFHPLLCFFGRANLVLVHMTCKDLAFSPSLYPFLFWKRSLQTTTFLFRDSQIPFNLSPPRACILPVLCAVSFLLSEPSSFRR